MLKHYTKRKKDEEISKDTEKDLEVDPAKVGVGIMETEEEYACTNPFLECRINQQIRFCV